VTACTANDKKLWTLSSTTHLPYYHLGYMIRMSYSKLQALVYGILPSTTAVFSYAIGPRKLSANEQFFVGAQTVVSLIQTTQIISDLFFFITDHVAYASSNKTKRDATFSLFFVLPGVDASYVYVRVWALGCFQSLISTHTPSTGLRHPSFNHCRI